METIKPIKGEKPCPACGGAKVDKDGNKCPKCNGSGEQTRKMRCSQCDGHGWGKRHPMVFPLLNLV